jgi:hypothetical protein
VFALGHAGIGSRMLGPLRRLLPARFVFLGCLLPDLIDKPLFYGLLWMRGHADPLFCGTRTIGHSGLFLLALLALAAVTRSRAAWAVVAGVITHLLLDIGGEVFGGADPESSIWLAIFFPRFGARFPVAQFASLYEHLRISAQSAYYIAGEIVGGAILLGAFVRRRFPAKRSGRVDQSS